MSDHYRNLRPQLPRHYVPNPRLESWIDGVMSTTLTVFSGPAGYGKTSSVIDIAQTLESRGLVVAWLRMEVADNALETLFSNIFEALNATLGQNTKIAKAQGQANQNMLLEYMHDMDKPFVLVLDDLEYLSDEICLRGLSQLILRSPENTHILAAGRNLQGFPLSRLKVEGRLQLVQANELQFDNRQVGILLNDCYRLALDDAAVAAIAGIAECWPAGLQIIAFFLKSGRPIEEILDGRAGSVADISAYLWEEVFLHLPQATQQFLMDTCFLDRLNGDLCNHVTGREDSMQLLQDAYQSNLFLTLMDEKEGYFRFHNLFAEFLHNKLNQSRPRAEIRLMHERAAVWHVARSDHETALLHLFEVDAWAMACKVLEGCAWEVMGRGRIRMLLNWFESIPENELKKHSRLQVAFGWTLILSNKFSECYRLVQSLKKSGDGQLITEFSVLEPMVLVFEDRFDECSNVLPNAYDNTPAEAHLVQGTLHNIQTLLALNRRDYASVEPLVTKSRTEFLKAGAGYGENYAAWFQIASLLSQGYLRRAHELAEMNWSQTMETSLRFSSASALAGICLARTLFYSGKYSQAHQLITEHFDILCKTAMIDNVVEAVRIVNRIHCIEGDLDTAKSWLSACGLKTRKRNSQRINRALVLENRYRDVRAYDLSLAERAPEFFTEQTELSKSQFVPISEDVENDWTHNMRVKIRSKPQERHLTMIKRQIQLARTKGRGNYLLKLHILHAQTLTQLGQSKRAMKVFEECAQTAAAEGFISHFHEEGPQISKLTDTLCEILRTTQYLKRDHDLLVFFKGAVTDEARNPNKNSKSGAVHRLTKQEARIFELLGTGLSNDSIAERMSISVNTVKFHLKNIYVKLNVKGRARAVSIAASSRSAADDLTFLGDQ